MGKPFIGTTAVKQAIEHIKKRSHNPQYLPTAHFDVSKLHLTTSATELIQNSDCIVIAIPSAYALQVLENISPRIFLRIKK